MLSTRVHSPKLTFRRLHCLSAPAHAMATRAASVRDAAIKTGETCATKLQDGLTTTTQTFAA